MKKINESKQGISLIVLVITIIVMIILAAAVVLALSNSGIISKANEAVDATNLANVQDLATMLWAEAYLDPTIKNDAEKIKAYIETGLDNAKIDKTKYNLEVTLSGVTVTKAGEKVSNVPTDWQAYVSHITEDGVPIPKGFVASPYGADEANGLLAENTKAGGLVIYELNDKDIAKEDRFTSMTTRNQYVWVPVDNFEEQFVRKDYINKPSKVVTSEGKYNALGTVDVYWEVIIDEATKLPKTTLTDAEEAFMTPKTLTEVQAMYESVKEYKGFYIARYEAGYDGGEEYVRTESNYKDANKNIVLESKVYSMMNKKPYNYIPWTQKNKMDEDTDSAVEAARSMYIAENANYGVVSTLTYGVQWDRVLQWWQDTNAVTSVTNSTAYGNYFNNEIPKNTFNEGAKCSKDSGKSYEDITAQKTSRESWLLTTGATEEARVNNIYDMAGNLWEWTMAGYSTNNRVSRGGYFNTNGYSRPVSFRYGNIPNSVDNDVIGFRSSLYIKK